MCLHACVCMCVVCVCACMHVCVCVVCECMCMEPAAASPVTGIEPWVWYYTSPMTEPTVPFIHCYCCMSVTFCSAHGVTLHCRDVWELNALPLWLKSP